tara:strand:+ start:145 stop:1458 length:1314 start_codon:yes stop_codon:yes gene_type:complete
MAQMVVTHDNGIKNRFRLSESDFYKIPSMQKVDLGNQPTAYEAYLYSIKDLVSGRMYLGVHKLNDKLYWTSMKHLEGLRILQGDEKRIQYKILEYGEYSTMKNKEADEIDKHDAVRSPDFWNQMYGSYHKEKIRLSLVATIVSNIENGVYSITTETVSDLVKIPTWQVREGEYVPRLLKYIKSKINEVSGSTKNCNPIVILEDRLNKKLYRETDLRIDGAHTLEGAHSCGSLTIKVIRIPKEVHVDLSASEIEIIASHLNKDEEIRKEPNSKETLAKTIFGFWLRSRLEIDSDTNIQILKRSGKDSTERKDIFKKVEELKKSYLYETLQNVVLIDYQEADKKTLTKAVTESTTDTTLGISQSSSSLRWDRACEKLQDDTDGRKHLAYYVYHSTFIAAEELWVDEKMKLKERLDYWLTSKGYTYEIIEMPYKREKITL